MTLTTAHLSMSLDGFVAGPHQTADDPIGRGGMRLHQWHFGAHLPGHEVDARWTAQLLRPRGAYVMGRNMFGPALELARLAGDGDVDVAGGASAARQALASGELDELSLDIVPVLLGSGERFFDGTVENDLEIIEAEHSPWATHVRYRVTS